MVVTSSCQKADNDTMCNFLRLEHCRAVAMERCASLSRSCQQCPEEGFFLLMPFLTGKISELGFLI